MAKNAGSPSQGMNSTKYKGLTKKKYKKLYGSHTPGKTKGWNCQATPYEKALSKLPRAHKTFTKEYHELMKKQNKHFGTTKSAFD